MKILVTGGAGFIGSAVIRQVLSRKGIEVINLDKLTYAGNLESLSNINFSNSYIHENVDVCDAEAVDKIFEKHKPTCVMHLAAESHVDRSIDGPLILFIPILSGTFNLLEAPENILRLR